MSPGQGSKVDGVFVIHFQVREGCEGVPMDALEVAVPATVENPTPEAVDGWDVAVTPARACHGRADHRDLP